MNQRESLYRLRTFQLARLRHALSQRKRATDREAVRLADACVLSLYKSCLDVGDDGRARDLLEMFHHEATPGS